MFKETEFSKSLRAYIPCYFPYVIFGMEVESSFCLRPYGSGSAVSLHALLTSPFVRRLRGPSSGLLKASEISSVTLGGNASVVFAGRCASLACQRSSSHPLWDPQLQLAGRGASRRTRSPCSCLTRTEHCRVPSFVVTCVHVRSRVLVFLRGRIQHGGRYFPDQL